MMKDAAAPCGSRSVRLAVGLWLLLAVVVWNVVFDDIIRMAGRRYLYQAGMAALAHARPISMDAFMRPAAVRGAIVASLAAFVIVAFAAVAISATARASRRH